MKIVILGPAHPYRGGLASIMETMAREYMRRGDEVRIYTFSLQYPSLLFPGKSQTVDTPAPTDLHIERVMNTCNPLNWIRLGLRLRRERPDMVLMKYWTPFMAPCFGTIARIARGNGHTKFICQIDNVEPHERHIIDRPFNRYYLRAVDGFVYMSEQVHGELREYTSVPALFSPHPMFSNFGERVERAEACRALGLDANLQYLLFFGLIREYKGLDILLEAWSRVRRDGQKLIVAGEFYDDKERYAPLFARLGASVVLHDRFIADADVKYYFSVADALVLPYRTATQSGVTQIAYNFHLPMIVTDVGGLPEIVPDDKVGYVCPPTVEGVMDAIEQLYKEGNLDRFRRNIAHERKRFSWPAMCNKIVEVFHQTKPE
ncbi:MAG: glycosyltransferase family 4 protein [Alistipes sp.]|nr:glycosyltransferase family 4 protein [Alistipes sp.]